MIVVADLHLGSTTNAVEDASSVPSTLQDAIVRLNEVLDIAIKQNTVLVIAGDLFDETDPKSYVITELFRFFERAARGRVPICILPGNHDSGVKWSAVTVAETANFGNVKVFIRPKRAVSIEGLLVDILPHMSLLEEQRFFRTNRVKSYSEFFRGSESDILVGHAWISGAVNSSEVEMEAGDAIQFNPKKFPKYKLVVLGHIHKSQKINVSVATHHYEVLYPGSPTVLTFAEWKDKKSYVLIRAKKDGTLKYGLFPFKSTIHRYRVVKIDATKDIVLDEEKVMKVAKDSFLKIVVRTRARDSVNESKIKRAFNRYGKVLRFEYDTEPLKRGKVSHSKEVVFTSLDHVSLLRSFLKGAVEDSSNRSLALKLGKEVIQECLKK